MKKHWFQPKLYGYGFVPVTWQGWVCTAILLALVLIVAQVDNIFSKTVSGQDSIRFGIDLLVLVTLFCIFLRNKVEGGLKWRWGKKTK